jgi:hypothetical protein
MNTRTHAVLALAAVLSLLPACAGPRKSTASAPRTNPPAATATPEPAHRAAAADPPPAVIDYPAPPNVSPRAEPGQEGLRPLFAHIRVDPAAGIVEIDGEVPIDAHNAKTPRVYLETVVCTRDTKEHESLVVTDARPSEIHAALLLTGLEPGTPGSWDWEGATIRAIPPAGPAVRVTIRDPDGREWDPKAWVLSLRENRTLDQADPASRYLFAGSQLVKVRSGEAYRADREGCVVGLTTFGGEVIAWERMHSPEASVEEPIFIAAAAVPPAGTRVVVVIRRDPAPEPRGASAPK